MPKKLKTPDFFLSPFLVSSPMNGWSCSQTNLTIWNKYLMLTNFHYFVYLPFLLYELLLLKKQSDFVLEVLKVFCFNSLPWMLIIISVTLFQYNLIDLLKVKKTLECWHTVYTRLGNYLTTENKPRYHFWNSIQKLRKILIWKTVN